MRTKQIVWLGLLVVAIALTVAAVKFPYFPGDVPLARLVQASIPISKGWAQWVTSTAREPSSYVLLGGACVISWAIAGWEGALFAAFSFGGMWLLGPWLSPMVARPRPSPNLIHVVGTLSGYSFPSIFALTYASTFGFVAILTAAKPTALPRWAIFTLCCAALVVGGLAGVTLGAHWPSDVIVSYLIGLLWASLLIRFI